jgi:GNAT superfamily N-acetyltransferase
MDLQIIRLSQSHDIKPFDCGDLDLNEFILEDAKRYQKQLLAVTYIGETIEKTVFFFSLLNDKISVKDMESNNQWKKRFKDLMPDGKRFTSYPAVKIGRLGTDNTSQGKGFGTLALKAIKDKFTENTATGAKYLVVDAYKNSIPFYEKNGFVFLTKQDIESDTRVMYFDLMQIVDGDDI